MLQTWLCVFLTYQVRVVSSSLSISRLGTSVLSSGQSAGCFIGFWCYVMLPFYNTSSLQNKYFSKFFVGLLTSGIIFHITWRMKNIMLSARSGLTKIGLCFSGNPLVYTGAETKTFNMPFCCCCCLAFLFHYFHDSIISTLFPYALLSILQFLIVRLVLINFRKLTLFTNHPGHSSHQI